MGRKSIFEIIANQFDLETEVRRTQELLSKTFFTVTTYDKYMVPIYTEYTLFMYCDKYCFHLWEQRGRCISSVDLYKTLGLDRKLKETITTEILILYLEFLYNICVLCEHYCDPNSVRKSTEYILFKSNIFDVAESLNFEFKYDKKEEKGIIVEKNPTATAAADIVDPELAMQVIEYNHHLLKGDIEKKRKILLSLSQKLDAIRAEIPAQIAADVYFLLNNLNIRHNNVEQKSKDYKEFTAKMSPKELETWYDELYQIALLALLTVDHKERAAKIAELKTNYK